MKFQLTDDQKQRLVELIVPALIVLGIQLLGVFGYAIVLPRLLPPAPQEISAESLLAGGAICKAGDAPCIDSRYGRNLIVWSDSGSTQKWKVTGSSGTTQHAGFDIVDAATSITVTNGITNLTPLGSYQRLTAAGTVTVTSLVTSTATFPTGTRVTFINTSAQNVVWTNGTYLLLPSAANLTLGQYDVLQLWFDGTRWITTFATNN